MAVADVEGPSLDFLEQTDGGCVLIVAAGLHPAVEYIAIGAETRPPEVLLQKDGRLDRRGPVARREREVLVVGARKDGAGPKRQGGSPPGGRRFAFAPD